LFKGFYMDDPEEIKPLPMKKTLSMDDGLFIKEIKEEVKEENKEETKDEIKEEDKGEEAEGEE